jgi:chloramphenicol-sensitive protein RarD
LFPLYWPLLEPAGAVEILAQRIVWTFVAVLVLLAVLRSWSWLPQLLRDRRRFGLLAMAAVVITFNWGTYIYGVNSGQVVETSLGYFINPLVTVLLGVVLLGERLRVAQWIAVGIATVAVGVLTVDYGRVPWIALVLAFSFATYGLLKKKANVGAVQSLAVETGVLLLPMTAYLLTLTFTGRSTFGQEGIGHAVLLAGSGVVTAIPLLFFGAAAIRIPLTQLGLLQYLAPTLQLAIGVLLYNEPMPPVRLLGFALVWTALVVFTIDSLASVRRRQLELTAHSVG